MAKRREFDGVHEADPIDGEGFDSLLGGDSSAFVDRAGGEIVKGATADEDVDMIGQPDPDESGPVGNTEPGKPRRDPTTFAPRGGDFNLPQGVTVNEGMFSGVPDSGNAMASPAMPSEPSPLAMGAANPIQGPPEGGINRGPMRRSQQSSSLFAQSSSPMLSGRAGGLLGGGLGAAGGSEPSGPLQPTQMFQKLLELFKQG